MNNKFGFTSKFAILDSDNDSEDENNISKKKEIKKEIKKEEIKIEENKIEEKKKSKNNLNIESNEKINNTKVYYL